MSENRDLGGGDGAAASPEVAMQVAEEHVDSHDLIFILTCCRRGRERERE